MAEAFLQAATQAPQPMQAAASIDESATVLGMGIAFPSDVPPVLTDTHPLAWMIRSKAVRLATRSLTMGNALARQGSIVMVSPSWKWRMCNWQVAVPRCPPWGIPLITSEHMPQMPSRQSESNAIGS